MSCYTLLDWLTMISPKYCGICDAEVEDKQYKYCEKCRKEAREASLRRLQEMPEDDYVLELAGVPWWARMGK